MQLSIVEMVPCNFRPDCPKVPEEADLYLLAQTLISSRLTRVFSRCPPKGSTRFTSSGKVRRKAEIPTVKLLDWVLSTYIIESAMRSGINLAITLGVWTCATCKLVGGNTVATGDPTPVASRTSTHSELPS